MGPVGLVGLVGLVGGRFRCNVRSRYMKSYWTRIAIAAVAVLLTLAFVRPYGVLNQATYLLDPLHRAMPELFRRDWFVSETPPYLPVFGWLAQWLYVIDPEGSIAILIAHVVVTVATYAAIYWLVSALVRGWQAFAIVASFVTVSMGLSMGGSYLLAGYFQPSSLATLGWVVAIAAFARDRYLVCGISAALAGGVHANFLVLGIGLFGLAALARRDLGLRDFAALLGPQLAVLACFLPQLLAAAGPSEQAVWILTRFHAPVHYAPARLTSWIKDVLAWQIGAYAALTLIRDVKAARVLWRFSLVAFAIVTASALVIRFTPLESLTQVRWSRIGPFGQLACQSIIAAALVRQAVAPNPLSVLQRISIGLGLLVPLYQTGGRLHLLISWPAIGIGAALALLVLVPWPRVSRTAVGALAVAGFVFALWRSERGSGLTTVPAASANELALARWAREHTPLDSLFLAPPALQRFRLLARRAVIVDTKSPPLHPDLLVAWYGRLCAMTLFPDAPTWQAVEERYAQLTPGELEQVARSFAAEYIIASPTVAFAQPPVFANAEFAVHRVPRYTGTP